MVFFMKMKSTNLTSEMAGVHVKIANVLEMITR